MLVGVALNCGSALTTFARAGDEEPFRPATPLFGTFRTDRLPPTTRSPYDDLGVYSLIGDAPDTAGMIARLSQLPLNDHLPSVRLTLELPDQHAATPAMTGLTPIFEVGVASHAELMVRMTAALRPSDFGQKQFLKFHGNGGNGVMTWLSDHHAVDINPSWLDFSMFDSMKMDVMNGHMGPGESEPQIWRSAFTVGMGTALEIHPGLAFQAGYRFYDNPMPADRASGALLNATQHVIAASLGYRQGAHSLTLTYGLDLMATDKGASISSARYGDNLASTAHLVSFVYAFAF